MMKPDLDADASSSSGISVRADAAPGVRRGWWLLAGLALMIAPGLVGVVAAARAKPTAAKVITTDLAQWRKAFAEARARPGTRAVLVNVWATWCEPCKEEMPDLIRFAHDPRARDVRVMLISADSTSERAAVTAYLSSLGVDFPTYLKTGDDMEFINGIDPKWNGTIPSSWLFDPAGNPAQLWNGKVTYDELIARLEKLSPAAKPVPHPSARRKP